MKYTVTSLLHLLLLWYQHEFTNQTVLSSLLSLLNFCHCLWLFQSLQTEIDHREKVITHTDNLTDKQLDHVHHETKAQSAEGKLQNSEVMKTGEIPVKRSGKAAKEEVTRILKGEIWNVFFVYERHTLTKWTEWTLKVRQHACSCVNWWFNY